VSVAVRRAIPAVALLAVCAARVHAEPLYLAVDVPTTVAGATYRPHQIVRYEGGAYSIAAELPEEVGILALDRAQDGRWLFVPAHPVSLAGADFSPRDVVVTNGTSFTKAFDGAAAGLPEDVRIDALMPDGAGAWILSFDVPVTLGGTDFSRSDLVHFVDNQFTLLWNAALGGVPAYANVVGVGHSGPGFVVSFDVPVQMGSSEVLPGQIVRTDAESLGSFATAAAWPPGSQLRDFAVSAPLVVGAVPGGNEVAGVPLTVRKEAGGTMVLQWGAACGEGAVDYIVYRGSIGAWAATVPETCSTGGARVWSAPYPQASSFFLVVGRSDAAEGSYGLRSDGSPRPVSASACVPQETGSCSAAP
jgi:hypothetical protein